MARLTQKQQLFVLEYLQDFNGTRAAVAAGYSEETARQIASENLSKPVIKQAIREQIEILFANKEKILVENIKFWNEVRNNDEEKTQDRVKASELLGKYAGMFKDVVEHTGNIVTTNIDYSKLSDTEAKELYQKMVAERRGQ